MTKDWQYFTQILLVLEAKFDTDPLYNTFGSF